MTTIKEVFETKINQEIIYESIIRKNFNFHLKPVLACLCVFLIGSLFFKQTSTVQRGNHQLSIHNINQTELVQLDLDVKISENASFNSITMYNDFPFLKQLEKFKDYQWNIYFMYVKENQNSNDYNLLHDYVFTLENNESRIEIHFSQIEEPLRCVFTDVHKKLSMVNDVPMLIQQFNETYYVTFENNGIYFDIKSINMSLDELIEVLEIITSNI